MVRLQPAPPRRLFHSIFAAAIAVAPDHHHGRRYEKAADTCTGVRPGSFILGQDKVALVPARIRYSWPSELDLMAQLAGLQLVERWANWQQEPLTGQHPRHISIYGHAEK